MEMARMILRIERDGIEFFINTETGKTGISISGLARLCGVSHVAIIKLLERVEALVTKNVSKSSKGNPSKAKPLVTKNPGSVVTKNASENPKGNPSKAKTVSTKNILGTEEEKLRRGRPSQTEEDLSESLLELLKVEIYLEVGLEYKNVTVIAEEAIGLFVEYYALDAYETRDEAKTALRKFNRRGVRGWIYEVVEWKPQPKAIEPKTRAQELGIKPRYVCSVFDRHIFYNDLFNKELTAPMYRVYLYFLDCHITGHAASVDEVCKYALVAKHHLYDLIQKMQPYGLVPEYFEVDDSTRSIEAQILAKMHEKLGGNVEVQTIHGPIDLLTPTELIEIKRIEDWKEGLGQVMVKSHAFPDHTKRLHLFGQSDRTLRNIKATCKQFEISVSFETAGTLTR
jgi:hypothetical protein